MAAPQPAQSRSGRPPPGPTQAVAAARAGGIVSLITQLGMDFFGDEAYRGFQAEGIDVSSVFRTDRHPTGAALILVDERRGENAILVVPGACGHMDPGAVGTAILARPDSGVLVVQFETNVEAMVEALLRARERGMTTICNPAPARDIPESCLPLVDYLTPNESEAAALAGIPVESVDDARRAAIILRSRGIARVIVTLGAAGAYVLDRTGEGELVHAFPVDAVDTTGAGDAFTGAFAVAIAEGKELVEAARFANACAAVSVTRIGTAPAMPVRGEILDLLARYDRGRTD